MIRKKAKKGLILPAATRWTSTYLACERALDLQKTIALVVAEDMHKPRNERMIVRGDARTKERAEKALAIVNDPVFWTELAK